MISTEDLSELLAALYAAPLQPGNWQVFFDRLSGLMKISVGSFFVPTDDGRTYTLLAGGGFAFDPELFRMYNEYYAPSDPFVPPVLANPRLAVIRGEELVSHDQLSKTGFYNDLLRGNEMESATILTCVSGAGSTDAMSMWRRKQDGPMDDASIAFLGMLLPHVQAALTIRRNLLSASIQSQFADLALEANSVAVFLVSAAGRVVHMNGLAAAFVQKADGLRLEGALLAARNPTEDARLKLFIAGAASTSGKRTLSAPGGALSVSRQRAKCPLQVCVLPVPEKHRSIVGLPCALVFVRDPGATLQSRVPVLCALYALTPAEARLADMLLQGLELGEAASRMKITYETARFQLKRVLSKTGTHRQSELMRLMLSLPGQ
jgi:DNA-binding CsgD family transcriptional regulator/PAS domain-containing protein